MALTRVKRREREKDNRGETSYVMANGRGNFRGLANVDIPVLDIQGK